MIARSLYPRTLKGLLAYGEDVEAAKQRFAHLELLFAPEIDDSQDLDQFPDELVAVSDYFICELPSPAPEGDDRTNRLIRRLHEIAEFSSRTSSPVFVAHPFRSSVNRRLIKRPIEPWVSEMPPRAPEAFSPEELNRFFFFDIERFARECVARQVPVEINGGTHRRIQLVNLPVPMQMLKAAYSMIRDVGASFIRGSDLHGLGSSVGRAGGSVPSETFDFLGVTVSDIAFLDNFDLKNR